MEDLHLAIALAETLELATRGELEAEAKRLEPEHQSKQPG